MQIKINDAYLQIVKSYYNKSKVQEDGITHIIDTEHQYPLYQFGLAKNYFDIEDKNDLLRSLVDDLRDIASELEAQIEKESKGVER